MLLKLNVHLIPGVLVTTGRGGRRAPRGKKKKRRRKRGAGPRAGTWLVALGKSLHCRLLTQLRQSPACPGEADPCAPQSGSAPAAPPPSSILPPAQEGGPEVPGGSSLPGGVPREEQVRERAGERPAPPPGFTSIADAAAAAGTPIPGGQRRALLR